MLFHKVIEHLFVLLRFPLHTPKKESLDDSGKEPSDPCPKPTTIWFKASSSHLASLELRLS